MGGKGGNSGGDKYVHVPITWDNANNGGRGGKKGGWSGGDGGGNSKGSGKQHKGKHQGPAAPPVDESIHALKSSPSQCPQYSNETMPRAPDSTELPVHFHAEQIRQAASSYQVICVQGETGCGKSSVVPVLLEDIVGYDRKIACTQPRRLAAISLAARVASQRNEQIGQSVGYRVGMDGKTSDDTRINFVTTGWLLMYLAHKPDGLKQFNTIVLDEIHERDLDMDLLCVLLKKSLETHADLRIVIMSATLDANAFLSYFKAPGVAVLMEPIRVGSRRFPTWPYFLDDIPSAVPGLDSRTVNSVQRLVNGRFGAPDSKVDVAPQLFQVCVQLVEALATPGTCFLIFLPGLSEIEQLHAEFVAHDEGRRIPYVYHLLHSIIPHETQQRALPPAPHGHIKIVLSTNIAESSVTIPDVRYVIDFGIIRKLILDDERGMLTLCNTWCSRATCMQRRGRCGRLAEGVILYLFPRRLYSDTMQEYAQAESLTVPLETMYLKATVLLSRLGTASTILRTLMDPPGMQRIQTAEQNLRDLGAIGGSDGAASVTALGRVAVFMPTTIQLSRLVLLSWAFGNVVDGVVIAAALSTQDVFKLCTPQACNRLEEFPKMLAHNYITRMTHDDGQFSEPIMYRNLFVSYLKAASKSNFNFHQWLENNCVSVSRIKQFVSLAVEIAMKFIWAVPEAGNHKGLRLLSQFKQNNRACAMWENMHLQFDTSPEAYTRLKFVLCGGFAPSFVLGEINQTNKNKPKFMSSGYEPLNTCLLQNIKPPELRNDKELFALCEILAPVNQLWIDNKGIAYIDCGNDCYALPHRSCPPTVHQMPLLAQLLHQLSRLPCKFPTLRRPHEATKIGNANFLNGIRWHLAGQGRLMAQPYWRSVLGYMCEMRSELKAHYGVCASLLGRDGPDQVRVSGLTILPPPGEYFGALMILTFLSGPVTIEFLPHNNNKALFKGVRATYTDCAEGKPMLLTFSPRFVNHDDIAAVNHLRHVLNQLLNNPSQEGMQEMCASAVLAVEHCGQVHDESGQPNTWFPFPFDKVPGATVKAECVPVAGGAKGGLPYLRVPNEDGAAAYDAYMDEAPYVEEQKYSWLRHVSGRARSELFKDLHNFQHKYGIVTCELLPDDLVIEGTLTLDAITELGNLMRYYEMQAGWTATEMREETLVNVVIGGTTGSSEAAVTKSSMKAPLFASEVVGGSSGSRHAPEKSKKRANAEERPARSLRLKTLKAVEEEKALQLAKAQIASSARSSCSSTKEKREEPKRPAPAAFSKAAAMRRILAGESAEKKSKKKNVPFPTPWLAHLNAKQRNTIQSDMNVLAARYGLTKALIVGDEIEIEGLNEAAKVELATMFDFYQAQSRLAREAASKSEQPDAAPAEPETPVEAAVAGDQDTVTWDENQDTITWDENQNAAWTAATTGWGEVNGAWPTAWDASGWNGWEATSAADWASSQWAAQIQYQQQQQQQQKQQQQQQQLQQQQLQQQQQQQQLQQRLQQQLQQQHLQKQKQLQEQFPPAPPAQHSNKQHAAAQQESERRTNDREVRRAGESRTDRGRHERESRNDREAHRGESRNDREARRAEPAQAAPGPGRQRKPATWNSAISMGNLPPSMEDRI